MLNIIGVKSQYDDPNGARLIMILRQSRLRAMLFAAFFAWFICGIGYYALTISASGPSRYAHKTSVMTSNPRVNIGSVKLEICIFSTCSKSLYTSTILSAVVEIPGSCLAAFLLGYTRRVSLSGFLIAWGISGISAPLFTLIGGHSLRNALAFFCKMCATACFTLVYISTQELFPTRIR